MKYYFSPSKVAFYQDLFRNYYESAGSWPEDAGEITGAIFDEFTGITPDGKLLSSVGGQPVWADMPAPSEEEMIAFAEQKRSALRQAADREVEPLQDAVDLEIATDAENFALKSWKQYRVLLNRIDTSLAPNIEWPVMPQ